MMEKERMTLTLNCEVCDATKIKEENYRHYEEITINAELLLISETGKSMLNRLPVTLNIERTIETSSDKYEVKTINGSYEITSQAMPQTHTILIVNGSLKVEQGAQDIASAYECIIVNGSAELPESLAKFDHITVNGSSRTYPDDCIILEDSFVIDKYFPTIAKENANYYAHKMVTLKNTDVDTAKLVQKNVHIISPLLIVHECMIESCVSLFSEHTEITVIPDGFAFVNGNVILDEALLQQYGTRLYVYGNLSSDMQADMDMLCSKLDKLVVTGTVSLYHDQSEAFCKVHAEYSKIEFLKRERKLHNMLEVKLDKSLFDHSPDGISVCNVVKVVIADDVTPEMILDSLSVTGCSRIECAPELESALCAIGVDLGRLRNVWETGQTSASPAENTPGAKTVNAEHYIM